MSDYISREAVQKALEKEREHLRARGMLNAEHVLLHHALEVLDKLPAAEVKTLEKIGEEVDEALCILDEARDDGMDYGYYRDLHDAIAGIAVPDFGADMMEEEHNG